MEAKNKTAVHPNAKTINIKSNSKREFFLIHGYTGCPSDLNDLGKFLHKKFNANIKIIRLKGHGTKVQDLDNLDYHDFVEQIEKELKKDISKGMKIVLGGYSFGGQLALYLASKYKIKGVFHVSSPIKLRFPLNIPFIERIIFFKNYYKKVINPQERKLLKETFFYEYMHRKGLVVCKKANKELIKNIYKISVPYFGIHSKKDFVSKFKGLNIIEKKIGSKIKYRTIIEYKGHNLFFTKKDQVFNELNQFIKVNNLFGDKKEIESVSAIVPAYNEGDRIFNVLKILLKTSVLDEVIVIDDGSNDDTYKKVIEKFKGNNKLKVSKNNKNMGKAYSMDKGVKNSKGDIIFFCDADLNGLTSKIVEEIINPVKNKEFDMFIGIRKNKIQN